MKRIAIIVLVFLILCACVPTPEEEVVNNKGDGVLTEKIAEGPVAEKAFEAPARVDETIEADRLTVELAAEVVLPEGDRYPHSANTGPTAGFTAQRVSFRVSVPD